MLTTNCINVRLSYHQRRAIALWSREQGIVVGTVSLCYNLVTWHFLSAQTASISLAVWSCWRAPAVMEYPLMGKKNIIILIRRRRRRRMLSINSYVFTLTCTFRPSWKLNTWATYHMHCPRCHRYTGRCYYFCKPEFCRCNFPQSRYYKRLRHQLVPNLQQYHQSSDAGHQKWAWWRGSQAHRAITQRASRNSPPITAKTSLLLSMTFE